MTRKFTKDELKTFNGTNGQPAYIAHKGKVYDVSNSSLWTGGTHIDGHEAGKDLTPEIGDAPHGEEVLADLTVVGELA